MCFSLIRVLGEHISASRGLPNVSPPSRAISNKDALLYRCHELALDAALINWSSWANKPNTPPV